MFKSRYLKKGVRRNHVSIKFFQFLMSGFRKIKQITNIPITERVNIVFQPLVWFDGRISSGIDDWDLGWRSGMFMTFTISEVQPVNCSVLWPLPVSWLYCSHAKPVSFQDSKTAFTRFRRSSEYMSVDFC